MPDDAAAVGAGPDDRTDGPPRFFLGREGRYRLRADRLSRWSRIGVPAVAAGAAFMLFRSAGGTLYPFLAAGMIGALLLLAALSMPRYIEVTAGHLIVLCLLEPTIIAFDDIGSVELLSGLPEWSVPLAGVWGFGGYYGYWLEVRRMRLFKIYTAHRGACLRLGRRRGCDIVVDASWIEE